MLRRQRMRKLGLASIAAAALLAGVTACGTSTAGGGANSVVHLTLWQNYGADDKARATTALIAAFEKLHPNVKITDVSQPGTNYFALLNAAAISGSGPDLAVEFTGSYDLIYQNYELNLKPYLTSAEVAGISGGDYASAGFNTKDGLLVVPLDHDSYIGYYNKALFAKAGIKSVPLDWSQLEADCTQLKAHGITPMIYGNTGALVLGAEFYPWFDMTYLMAGIYAPTQFKDLYAGTISWTSRAILSQLEKWDALRAHGCTNSDVLTNSNTLSEFVQGKGAMIVDGTFDSATLESGLGKNLGVFVPPYSDTPVHGITQYPGDGYAVMKYSKHIPQAVEFEKFLLTTQAAQILAQKGVTPNKAGFTATDPVNEAIQQLIKVDHYAIYPYLDNIVQPNVVNAGQQVLDGAFAGDESATAALKNLQKIWSQLPASQRGGSF